MELKTISKILIFIGIFIIMLGVLFLLLSKFNIKIPFGKFPGDISIKKDNFSFYFPITTCIIVSVILSWLIWALNKFLK